MIALKSLRVDLDLPNVRILSLNVDNLFQNVLSHDTVEFEQKINMINNKAVRVPTKQH